MKTTSVRVATTNNFNCTPAEWNQLDSYTAQYPDCNFFINSNIHTPQLKTIAQHNYKAVVTVNPNIKPMNVRSILARLKNIQDKVAFVRVKYIPNNRQIKNLIKTLARTFNVVITNQRFNSIESTTRYANLKSYTRSCSRYRLSGRALDKLHSIADTTPNTYICDRKGQGCQGCGLCSTLTVGERLPVKSLNLSTSGVCPFNCPDCYAKTMQHFLTSIGNKPINYDIIMRNRKQAGTTKHIQENIQ